MSEVAGGRMTPQPGLPAPATRDAVETAPRASAGRAAVTFPDARSTYPDWIEEGDPDYLPGFIDGAPLPDTVAAVYGT